MTKTRFVTVERNGKDVRAKVLKINHAAMLVLVEYEDGVKDTAHLDDIIFEAN